MFTIQYEPIKINIPLGFYLHKIKLINFKNHLKFSDELNSKFNAIVGSNGIGKTNLLDAVHYVGLAKSKFASSDKDLVSFGENFFRIEAELNNDTDNDRGKMIVKFQNGKKKELSWNNKKLSKRSDHIGKIPIVLISPNDMVELFATSESRRKLLDSTLIQFDRIYLNHLVTYNQLLKQRNALLKQLAENRTWNETLVEVLDEKMKDSAEFIFKRRTEESQVLVPVFRAIHQDLTNHNETCSLSYQSELEDIGWLDLMKQAREKDRILRRSTSGVHKDDLVFLMEEKKLKSFGSQGQLKSFVFALKLAQFHFIKQKTNLKPILILDDIFDKLDDDRVKSLISIISDDSYGQIFISNTSEEMITGIFNSLNLNHKIIRLPIEIED